LSGCPDRVSRRGPIVPTSEIPPEVPTRGLAVTLIKKLLLPVALLAVVSAAALASSAFAGGKGVTTYDPARHAAVTSYTIHLYSFRWLVARTQLTVGLSPDVLKGRGVLHETLFCSPLHRCIRSTKVQFKLAHPRACPARDIFGAVYSHLYVRPYGATRWRELLHYHSTVAKDCR
jgi:hypothetical protein